MAAVATNGAASSMDEAHSKPPEGVVLPPKDVRAIIEKTAGYVARNGENFEERIRAKEAKNPKFSFLTLGDAYRAFYDWRLSEIRAGRTTDVAAGRAGEGIPVRAPPKPKGPEKPPDFEFSARMPNINAQDLDVVRLTALYAAKNGRSWSTNLSHRESSNYQFDFLRPQHSLYPYFQRLVEQYKELLVGGVADHGRPQKARAAQLEHNVKDRFHVLERAKRRAEWVKHQEQQKAKKEEEAEKERLAYQQIDWHDFMLASAEPIVFTEEDEKKEFPPPFSLSDLQSASLEQKGMLTLPPHLRIEEAMPTDEPSYEAPQPVQMPAPQSVTPTAAPQTPYVPTPSQSEYPPAKTEQEQEEEEEQRIRERAEAREREQQAKEAAKAGAPMRIRNDYVPRAQARRQNVQTQTCPICKQQIPTTEIEQHIRVEQLDPRWREQKAKAESRYATTNLSTQDVANNLKRLASQRSDVFDAAGQPVSEDEAARRKKAAMSYDGQPEGKGPILQQMQNLNVEEQIRQIHQKYKQ